MATEREETVREFKQLVNMTAKELEKWLGTEESQSVGQKTDEGAESTGHQSGRNIVQLLHKKQGEYTDDDVHEMGRVRSYIKRHLAQKPGGDVRETHWRYSLMNWGHDPCKDNGTDC